MTTLTIPGAVQATKLIMHRGLTAVVYANPGTGKTWLAAGLRLHPDGRDVLFLDCEGGSLTLVGLERVQVVRIDDPAKMESTLKFLKQHVRELNIGTVVVDTVSAFQRMGLTQILGARNAPDSIPQIADYGKSNEIVTRTVRRLADLADAKVDRESGEIYGAWNVLFLCHLTESKDEATGEMVSRPALTPRVSETTCGIVDAVIHMTTDSKSGQRLLLMRNYKGAIGKIRQPTTQPHMPTALRVPHNLNPDGSLNDNIVPPLVRILQHMQGEINLNDRDLYPELFPPKAPEAPKEGEN